MFDKIRMIMSDHERLMDGATQAADGRLPPSAVLVLILMDGRPMTPAQMKRNKCCFGSNASYHLNQLAERGYLDRVDDPNDMRKIIYTPTEKASEFVKSARDRLERYLSA